LSERGASSNSYHSLAFGFLGGKDIEESGQTNIGFHDRQCITLALLFVFLTQLDLTELFALEWVQAYISAFGGDPEKVMM
jgi:hypothetical protein